MKRAKEKTRNVNRCRPADGYGKPLHSRFRWPSTTLLPSRPHPLFSFTIGLARGKIVMYDDETEVFNLANRCLETSIPDPKTWELLAIPGIGGGRGGDDSWNERNPRYDFVYMLEVKHWSDRLSINSIYEVRIWLFLSEGKEIVFEKNSLQNYRSMIDRYAKEERKVRGKNHRFASFVRMILPTSEQPSRCWNHGIIDQY